MVIGKYDTADKAIAHFTVATLVKFCILNKFCLQWGCICIEIWITVKLGLQRKYVYNEIVNTEEQLEIAID